MKPRTYLLATFALALLGLFLALRLPQRARPSLDLSRTVPAAPPPHGPLLAEADVADAPQSARHTRTSISDLSQDALVVREDAHRISGIVVDPQQAPVESAVVELLIGREPSGFGGLLSRPPSEREGSASQGAHQAAKLRTDASGGFSFEAPSGFWTLRVTHAGMAPFEEEALRAGDFRWIQLVPSAEVLVRTVDESGAPISGAEVRVVKGRFTDPYAARVTAQSNASGEALLRDVPTGSWFVRVASPSFVTKVVKLPPSKLDAPALDVVLLRGLTLEGRVSAGEAGTPPSDALVRIDTDDGLVTSHSVRCDPDGRYRSSLAFPRGSEIEIGICARGYGELRTKLTLSAPEHEWTVRHDVTLTSPERVAVGRALSADGDPLPGVEVYARPLTNLPQLEVIQIPSNDELRESGPPDLTAFAPQASHRTLRWLAATTDERGDFRAAALHPTRPYELLLTAKGHAGTTVWIEPGDPGSTVDCGSIRLSPAGRVAGTVRRADGSALAGAHVYAVASPTYALTPDSEFETTRPRTLAAGLETTTGQAGHFAMEPFPLVPFRLMCQGVMYGPFEFDADGQLAELDLVAEDLHRRAQERALPLTLSVTDALGGPVPKAYLEIDRVAAEAEADASSAFNGWQWARGDASGRAAVTVASTGRYAVTVKDMEGLLESRTVFVDVDAAGAECSIELNLSSQPPGTLEGTVLSFAGEPLRAMDVTLIPVAGTTSCNCMEIHASTNDDGSFSFGHFMAGQHRLVVTDPSGELSPGQLYPAVPGQALTIRMQ